MRKLHEEDEVWKEVIKCIIDDKVPKMQKVRGKIQEVISVRQIFNPTLFVLHNGILCHNHHTDPAKPYDVLLVCTSCETRGSVQDLSQGCGWGP